MSWRRGWRSARGAAWRLTFIQRNGYIYPFDEREMS